MGDRQQILERLRAYIHPNCPRDEAQRQALEQAADLQLDHERQSADLPAGVQSMSIGSYSVTRAGSDGAAYSRSSICPAAWAVLFTAGLLRRTLPQAQRV